MAVVGTGKLGILIAQALVAVGGVRVTAFGRRDANFRPSPPAHSLPPTLPPSLPPSLPADLIQKRGIDYKHPYAHLYMYMYPCIHNGCIHANRYTYVHTYVCRLK